jgi:Bacterial Ig domain
LSVTVDTKAPTAPVLKANSVVNTNHVQLSGTAEAGSAVKVYDGSNPVGNGTADANGSWSIATDGLFERDS